jgi:hypothetical protein
MAANSSILIVQPRQRWSRRHWKAILIVAVGLSFGGAIAAFSALRNADAVKLAVATAETNPLLGQELGSPLRVGWIVSGSIEVSPGAGHAELTIPVSGPREKGTLYVEAHKRAGLWKLEFLEFGRQNSSDRLDLLKPAAAAATAGP